TKGCLIANFATVPFEGFIISKSGHKYVFVSALTGNLGSNLTSSIKAKKNAITILNTLNL
ncbi:TPA: hypothetical protein L9015_005617, partial [Klebsiella pneumoniae]|nr:hypothetical protein [Klebsiella pneumoniae]